MKMKKLTAKQIKEYIANPAVCIDCGGVIKLEDESMEEDIVDYVIVQDSYCENCLSRFTEEYTLTNIKRREI